MSLHCKAKRAGRGQITRPLPPPTGCLSCHSFLCFLTHTHPHIHPHKLVCTFHSKDMSPSAFIAAFTSLHHCWVVTAPSPPSSFLFTHPSRLHTHTHTEILMQSYLTSAHRRQKTGRKFENEKKNVEGRKKTRDELRWKDKDMEKGAEQEV